MQARYLRLYVERHVPSRNRRSSPNMRARTRRTLLGVATGLGAALLLTALRGTYVFEAIELKTLDARVRDMRDASNADSSIVILDLDNLTPDRTRHTLGRWPWPRDVWAIVTDYVAAGGARAIAYDFEFYEPDLVNPAADSAFASSSQRAGTVVQTLALQRVTDTAQVLA